MSQTDNAAISNEDDEVPGLEDEDNEVVWKDREPAQKENARKKEPRTVAAGFAEFRKQLVPKYTESDIASATLHKIEKSLKRAFDLSFVAPYGSRGHGTNVQGFSAIDTFAVVPKKELFENSDKSLEKFKDALVQKFPDVLITEGRPVVVIPFGERRSEQYHIVPSYHAGLKGENDLFAVPAPRSRWVHICPAAHSIWLAGLNDTLSANLKDFIRIVKAWSYYNDDVVWRYYLELCAADYLKNDSGVVYSRDLCRFFTYLANRELAPFEDTEGCDQPVYGTCFADRENVMEFIRNTEVMAKRALNCEQRGNVADAFYWWRKIFDWRFASY